jgi:glutamine amidotransferase
VSAPHALQRQSCCDRRGQCHDSGWGLGHYEGGRPHVVRSALPAGGDPRFAERAAAVASDTLLAHVRKASAGSVAERNCHPFACGRWLFAHNGTLMGFADDPGRLRALIPAPLRAAVRGETDSEHAFYFVLGLLGQAAGSADAPAEAAAVAGAVAEGVRRLAELYPDRAEGPSQFNFVLTDGRVLAASRWGHTLYCAERRGPGPVEGDGPLAADDAYRAVAVASEPPSAEGAWVELPERSVLRIDEELRYALGPIGG